MAAKTTSGSGFRPYSCSPPSTWLIQPKIAEIFQGHFFEIFGVKVEKFKKIKRVTKIGHSRFFDILWPLCPSTIVPKFNHFHRVINFLGKCAFLDLADFWLIFRFFERIEVCAFVSRKLNMRRAVPQKRPQKPKFQNFHLFARPLCPNALRQRLRTDFILHPTRPASERPYAFEGDPLNFGLRPPWAVHPQKSFPPISQKS